MHNPAFRAYLESKVLTASTEELQLMLYEGAIRFAQVGRAAMGRKEYEAAQTAFERCDAILCELHAGLRPDMDAELTDKFGSLYTFCQHRLDEGNLRKDPQQIDDALRILQHLRETWVLVMEKIAEDRVQSTPREETSLAVRT